MSFSLSIALALATVLGGSSAAALAPQAMPQPQSVEQYTRAYFADVPVLADIASCESHFRQFDSDGNVLKNSDSSAVGIMQIMESVHSDKSGDLGIDIDTIQGNLAYARYLYDTQGTAPWNASKSCWGKSAAAKTLAMK